MKSLKSPPLAHVNPVEDIYFGTKIVDPYRWMEDYKSQEMLDWIEAQDAYAREYLSALPERNQFVERVGELADAAPVLFNFQMVKGRTFYQRRDPGDNLAKLCMRIASNGEEKILLNPNTMEGEVHTSIDRYKASPNGTRVAYSVSQGGSEEGTIQIMDVDSGTIHPETITRQRFGTILWLDDEELLYTRSPESDDPIEYYSNSRIHLHRMGDDPENDPVILGRGSNPEVEFAPIDIPDVKSNEKSAWAMGTILHGDAREISVFVTPRDHLNDPKSVHWTQVCDMDDKVTGCAIHGKHVYLMTYNGASRFKVVAVSAENPNLKEAVEIVAESDGIIEEVDTVGHYLVTKERVRGMGQIRLTDLDSGAVRIMPTPFEGNIAQWSAAEDEAKLLFLLLGWTKSLRIFEYDIEANSVEDTGWIPPSPFELGDLEAYQVMVPSHDGVEVPVSIVHRKGLKRDGNNPTILMGYGSYGLSIKPFFDAAYMAWYERGGVFAVAHIRGGGALGKDWHKAGQFENKENTIQDFIAAGEYLVKEGYTNPKRLAGMGGSGGGIPTGGSLVRRPDLFGAMVILVGVTNMIRMETTENGPPNVMEYGSVTTEAGFRGLKIMDAYHRVEDGVEYPAVLLTTGLNDPRVVVWMTTKMTARLQAATSSQNPIIMRTEEQGGHGVGSTKAQRVQELGEIFAFLWEQFEMND